MRIKFVLYVLIAFLSCVWAGHMVYAQTSDTANVAVTEASAKKADGEPKQKEEPSVPASPVIEELAPPAAAAPEAKPVAAPVTEAVPAKAVTPVEAAPVVPVAEKPAPVEVAPVAPSAPVAPVAVEDPDAATKHALESAVKNLGTADRLKIGTAVAQQEEVRRKVRELEGNKAMDLADQAWKDRNYSVAGEQYKIALSKLSAVPHSLALRNRASQRIPECEYEIILKMAKDGGQDESAITMGEEFLKQHPTNIRLKNLLSKLREKRLEISKQPNSPAEETPLGETEVDKQMRLGKGFMANREYAKSRACFESVLGLDPDNREAMRYLKVLGEREFSNKTVEREATVKRMNAEVRDAWNPRYTVINGRQVASNTKTNTPTSQYLEEKMKKIVIDEIEFRSANIHDVVDFLNKRSHDCDKTTDDETKKGVNIILNLGQSAAAAPVKKAGGEDVFAADDKTAGANQGGVPEVTFSARYITLFNALKIITDVSGLKSRIDGDIVVIVPRDWDPATMEMREYAVEPTFIEKVKTASAEQQASPQNRGINLEAGATEAPATDIKGQFTRMGIKFPPNSFINYSPTTGKMVVKNTADNLAEIEKILVSFSGIPTQIEIEARFVEVNETDLYEAGLEWLLSDNWEMMVKNSSSAYAPMTSNPRIQMNASTIDGGMTKGLRFFGTDSNGKTTAESGGQGTMGGIASFASVLTNPDLTLILHALEQNGNADLLSAPKITTISGQPATIEVVTEYIYPTSFEMSQPPQGGLNNLVSEPTVTPGGFEKQKVGVVFTVTPEVSTDNSRISLHMEPKVISDPIWYQYGSTIKRLDGTTLTLNMPQPFFQYRQLDTHVLIKDGATVVMGGLITENIQKTNDKIPILGDIPFLGALFRSKGEMSVKKNLLIFVTAKLVDASGHRLPVLDQDITPASAPAVAK